MKPKPVKDQYLSVAGIAAAVGRNRRTVADWEGDRDRNGFPARTKAGKLSLRRVREWMRDRAAGTVSGRRTMLDEVRLRQVRKLDIEIAAMEGRMVAVGEVKSTLLMLAQMVAHVFDEWAVEVGAMTGDVALLERAEQLAGKMRARLTEEERKCRDAS